MIIAGAGISAAVMALRLLDLRIPATCISLDRPHSPGIESIPDAAFPLISQLRLQRVLAAVGGEFVDLFENGWENDPPVARRGKWLHVQRTRLAEAIIGEAVHRGAKIVSRKALPELASLEQQYAATVDATGRSAAWSRPVRRYGNQVADLYEVSNVARSPARVVTLGSGWGYRLGAGGTATVGLVSPRAPQRRPLETAAARLGVDVSAARYLGRRPAFPQWCERPVEGRRIAVGDAAFAYSPIAGFGIRFALASAFAAAPVIRIWCENGREADAEAGTRFYENFVNQARTRHVEFLEKSSTQHPPEAPVAVPAMVSFCARRGRAELSVDSRIVMDEAVFIEGTAGSGETAVRWVGGLDLLSIEELARTPISTSRLIDRLTSDHVDRARAAAVVRWCLRKNVLQPANPGSG